MSKEQISNTIIKQNTEEELTLAFVSSYCYILKNNIFCL